eukprot:6205292-Pleurochrysis_carterae.AAC.1
MDQTCVRSASGKADSALTLVWDSDQFNRMLRVSPEAKVIFSKGGVPTSHATLDLVLRRDSASQAHDGLPQGQRPVRAQGRLGNNLQRAFDLAAGTGGSPLSSGQRPVLGQQVVGGEHLVQPLCLELSTARWTSRWLARLAAVPFRDGNHAQGLAAHPRSHQPRIRVHLPQGAEVLGGPEWRGDMAADQGHRHLCPERQAAVLRLPKLRAASSRLRSGCVR